jgi:hypothetical protein
MAATAVRGKRCGFMAYVSLNALSPKFPLILRDSESLMNMCNMILFKRVLKN